MSNEELAAEIQNGRRELLGTVADPSGLQGIQEIEERIWRGGILPCP